MKYSTIKNSTISISKIGFGCSNFGGIGSAPGLVGKGDCEKDCHRMLNLAYEFGINYYDTASTYGAGNSELILGKWLKEYKIPRDRVIISSKIGGRVPRSWLRRGGLSRKHIERELEQSLRRLQLEYLDVLFIHMPDPKTPIEETLSALNGAVIHGKVRELGASNVDLAYLRKSLAVISGNSFEEYKLIQNNYSFINRIDEKDLIPFCRLNEILYVGYGPLAGGVLSGKYSKGHDYPKNSRLHLRSDLYQSVLSEQMYSTAERLMTFARDIGIDLPTLMYAWLLEKGSADAFLIGPRSELQFRPLMHAMQLKLGEQEWLKLNKMLTVAK